MQAFELALAVAHKRAEIEQYLRDRELLRQLRAAARARARTPAHTRSSGWLAGLEAWLAGLLGPRPGRAAAITGGACCQAGYTVMGQP